MLDFLSGAGSFLSGVSGIAGAFGGKKGMSNKDITYHQDRADVLQRNLLKDQLPLMVEGAKTAGLHPLVAAGVNPATSSAVASQVGDSGGGFWDKLSDAGQNISRAAGAFSSRTEREKRDKLDSLLLEKAGLENDLLRSQISTINRPTTPPVGGSITGSNAGAEYSPVQLTTPTGPNGSKEGGAVNDFTYARTAGGGLSIVPSSDVKQRIEDSFIPQAQWSLRNTHILFNPPKPDPSEFPLPRGHFWRWYPGKQEWRPYKSLRY